MSSRQFHRWNLQSLSKMLKRASVMERGFPSSPQTMSYPHKCQQRSGKHVLRFTSVNSTLIWGEGLMKRYLFKYLIICMGSCTFVQSFQRILSMIVWIMRILNFIWFQGKNTRFWRNCDALRSEHYRLLGGAKNWCICNKRDIVCKMRFRGG